MLLQLVIYELDFQAHAAVESIAWHPSTELLVMMDADGMFQAFHGVGTQVRYQNFYNSCYAEGLPQESASFIK